MNTKSLVLIVILSLMIIPTVHADMISGPGLLVLGIGMLLIAGIVIFAIVWISIWIIRKIRNKNEPAIEKKSEGKPRLRHHSKQK